MQENQKTPQWERMKTANVISVVSICGLIILILLLYIVEIPKRNENLLFFLLGNFTTLIGGISWFLFNYKKKHTEDDQD